MNPKHFDRSLNNHRRKILVIVLLLLLMIVLRVSLAEIPEGTFFKVSENFTKENPIPVGVSIAYYGDHNCISGFWSQKGQIHWQNEKTPNVLLKDLKGVLLERNGAESLLVPEEVKLSIDNHYRMYRDSVIHLNKVWTVKQLVGEKVDGFEILKWDLIETNGEVWLYEEDKFTFSMDIHVKVNKAGW